MTVAQMFHALEPPENVSTRRQMSLQAGEALQARKQRERKQWIDAMMRGRE